MYATAAAKATGDRCKCCGQLLPSVRLGVRMYPQTARILDFIAAAGPDGIEARALFARAYSHRGRHKPSFRSLNAQIRQLRVHLAETGHTITSEHAEKRLWVYKLTKSSKLPGYGTAAPTVPDGDGGSPVPTKR